MGKQKNGWPQIVNLRHLGDIRSATTLESFMPNLMFNVYDIKTGRIIPYSIKGSIKK